MCLERSTELGGCRQEVQKSHAFLVKCSNPMRMASVCKMRVSSPKSVPIDLFLTVGVDILFSSLLPIINMDLRIFF